MVAVDEMDQLVSDYVLNAKRILLGKLAVEPDPLGSRIAAAPPRLHPADPVRRRLHTDPLLESWKVQVYLLAQQASSPAFEDGPSLLYRRIMRHRKLDRRVVPQACGRSRIRFDHFEAPAPAKDVVALSGGELARRLSFLLKELRLPFPDPRQACDNRKANGIVIEVQRRSYTDPARRRIDGKVEMLDVLPNYVDVKPAYLQLR